MMLILEAMQQFVCLDTFNSCNYYCHSYFLQCYSLLCVQLKGMLFFLGTIMFTSLKLSTAMY